jgi:hypothetical protein
MSNLTPNSDLKSLDRLVGTWNITGGAEGTIRYEWMNGGFFLFQHVDLGDTRGLEIIGHEHELEGDTLTIWSGERGSPAYYQGTFSADGNTLTGAWVYPGGGGYSSTATRAKGKE